MVDIGDIPRAGRNFKQLEFLCETEKFSDVVVLLAVDHDSRWEPDIASAGWWGRKNTKEVWPFLMLRDGRMDFGSSWRHSEPDEVRYATIDLVGRKLAVGDNFTLRYENVEYPLKLTRSRDIGELWPK